MAMLLNKAWPSALILVLVLALAPVAGAGSGGPDAKLQRLVQSYPDHLDRIEGNDLVWKDGSRMPIDDGKGEKSFDDWLEDPDIEDMLKLSYPAGTPIDPPPPQFDPGRARNEAFFRKLYGLDKVGTIEQDCRRAQANQSKLLAPIVWLPKKANARIWVSKFNGIPEKFKAVSAELDELPAKFDRFLGSTAGVFSCRRIAGTDRLSPHSFGITIDIGNPHWTYWRWDLRSKPKQGAKESSIPLPPYRNNIPVEIVHIFEKHGFIWGGRWSHYDTMHFEYRPELFDR